MALAKPSEHRKGAYFDNAANSNALAVVFEPKSVEKDVKNEYGGEITYRDEVTCDVTVFDTSESLDKLTPSKLLRNVKVAGGYSSSLVDVMQEHGASALLPGTLEKVQTKKFKAWTLRDLKPEVEAQVEAYLDKRKAAAAENVAAMPSFD